jgi:hypothetical protein
MEEQDLILELALLELEMGGEVMGAEIEEFGPEPIEGAEVFTEEDPFADLALQREVAAPAPNCQQYVPVLRRVLLLAQQNPRLKKCLCWLVCHKGSNPGYCQTFAGVLRGVLSILQKCPQYRAGFCNALHC